MNVKEVFNITYFVSNISLQYGHLQVFYCTVQKYCAVTLKVFEQEFVHCVYIYQTNVNKPKQVACRQNRTR